MVDLMVDLLADGNAAHWCIDVEDIGTLQQPFAALSESLPSGSGWRAPATWESTAAVTTR
ncbi:MAG: hypothetical protein P8Y13_09140 [Deinococcales bacterium]